MTNTEPGLNSNASLTLSSSAGAILSGPESKSQSQIFGRILRSIAAQLDYLSYAQGSPDPIATKGYLICVQGAAENVLSAIKELP